MTTAPVILVPTDFSDAARNATDYALELARNMNYRLLLFHVYNTPVVESPGIVGVLPLDLMQIEEDVTKRLQAEAEYLGKRTNVEISYESVNGYVADEIITAEEKHKPIFIVMGIKPAGPWREMLLGSTATDILLKVHTPLLIIPQEAKFRRLERVAFGNDPNVHTEIELPGAVKQLFEKFYSTIYVVTVLLKQEEEKTDDRAVQEKMEKHFENRFHAYYFLENDDLIEAINDFSDLNNIDMVVMMPYKHSFFERIFKSSNTKKLAFHTHVPLLSLANIR